MEVLVDEPGVVEPGGQHRPAPRPGLPDPRLPRLGPLGQPLLDELVERDRLGDRVRDQVVLEEELPLPLLAQRDRRDRRHADRGEVAGALALVPPLAAAEPLADLGPEAGTRKCLT